MASRPTQTSREINILAKLQVNKFYKMWRFVVQGPVLYFDFVLDQQFQRWSRRLS